MNTETGEAKKVKCPQCGEEVENLVAFSLCWQESDFRLVDNEGSYGGPLPDVVPVESIENEFECPKCSAPIATGYHSAVAFLKGEKAEGKS